MKFVINKTKVIILILSLSSLALIAVFPLFSILLNSLTDPNNLTLSIDNASKLIFLPFPISLNQYYETLFVKREILYYFWNTVKITVPILFFSTIFSLLSGYALAKFKFPFKRLIFFMYVLLMLLPIQINLVGTYILFDKMGLIGRYIGVILPGIFSPLGSFLIYQFAKSIPNEIIESARLDGANEIYILIKIIVPNLKAGISSMIILLLIDCQNMVELPMIILKDNSMYPLSIMLRYLGETDPRLIFATSIIFSIPILIVFYFLKDDLTQGIAASSKIKM